MLVVLPKENSSIESVLANTDWLDFDSEGSYVQLFMPRFDFDNTLSFKEILSELGIKDLFETDDCLPNITVSPAHISQIKQQCVINVEEEGTEAAAVTMAECVVGCPPPDDLPPIITMMLNRPFGFAIKNGHDQLLFMGTVSNITKNVKPKKSQLAVSLAFDFIAYFHLRMSSNYRLQKSDGRAA